MARSPWLLLLLPPLLAACSGTGSTAHSSAPPPPAAVLGQALDTVPLPAKLARMQRLLDSALARGITRAGSSRVVALKLIADRLLEVPPPFARLRSGYSTRAALRQVQLLADRLLLELRRDDVSRDVVMTDAHALRARLGQLRRALPQGGLPPQPSLDSLLARVPSTGVSGATPTDSGEH